MDVTHIQSFLNSKVTNCDTNGTQSASDFGYPNMTHAQYAAMVGWPAPPYTCLENYTENGLSAAQIIYNTAQKYQINPQVLIVLLQKEQGLVTDTWPLPSQYRTATGYGCPDTAACDSTYYGFTNQLTWAATMYRAVLNQSSTWYSPYVLGNNFVQWNPNSSCGGSTVNIQNLSTVALYDYTPYQPNQASLDAGYGGPVTCGSYGNRNFYLYFTDWFGSTKQSFLVRTPDSPTYYLLTNSKKYAIPNGDILYAYGIQNTPLGIVSDTYLNTVSDGGILNTIFTIPGDSTTYLADGGKKYGISSGAYCTMWGLACGNSNIQKEIGPEISNLLIQGGTLQPIMQFAGSNYLMQNGKKEPFITNNALTQSGYTSSNVTPIVNWTNAIRDYSIAHPENNTFIKFASNNAIYMYSGGSYFSIPNYQVFTNWLGLKTASYLDSQSSYNTTPPTPVAALSNFIVNNGVSSIIGYDKSYSLSNTNPTSPPLDISTYSQLSAYLADRPVTVVDGSKAIALPNGTIVALSNNTLQPIPSMTDLYMNFPNTSVLAMSNTLMDAYPVGKLLITPGRVFKPASSDAMYLYGADKQLWALGNTNELAATLTWIGDRSIISSDYTNVDYSTIKAYLDIVTIGGTPYIVTSSGILKKIPTNVIIDQTSLTPVDGKITPNMKLDLTDAKFIHFDNGTIFKVNDTEIDPISSLSTYNSLGGNSINTAQLPLKSLNVFRTGNSI